MVPDTAGRQRPDPDTTISLRAWFPVRCADPGLTACPAPGKYPWPVFSP